MNADKKTYLSSRVLSATPAQLVVIVFEGLFEAVENACRSLEDTENGRWTELHSRYAGQQHRGQEEYLRQIDCAIAILDYLLETLDFSVDMSKDLGAIYFYCRKLLLRTRVKKEALLFEQVQKILTPIHEGFREIARKETRGLKKEPAIMAGMTYGKDALNEVVMNKKAGLKA